MSSPPSGTRFTWLRRDRVVLPLLQLLTGVLTALASMFEWSLWWLCAIPWMVLDFPGLVLAIPVIAAALVTAGTVGFDWRSQGFFLGWFIAAPTLLSIVFCALWREVRSRREAAACRQGHGVSR